MGAILITCVLLILFGAACFLVGFTIGAHKCVADYAAVRKDMEKVDACVNNAQQVRDSLRRLLQDQQPGKITAKNAESAKISISPVQGWWERR